MQMIKIGLADDHILLRKGLVSLLIGQGFEVVFDCDNGEQLTQLLHPANLPDIVLMDISMPIKNGYETTDWLRKNYPLVKVIALSMYEDEPSVIRMLRNGARGYIVKDSDPHELKKAILDVFNVGFHHSDQLNGKILHSVITDAVTTIIEKLNERQIEFLKLCATEMTYREIAEKMHLSPRTIDGYRDSLFDELSVKNRIGLVIFAIKNHIVTI